MHIEENNAINTPEDRFQFIMQSNIEVATYWNKSESILQSESKLYLNVSRAFICFFNVFSLKLFNNILMFKKNYVYIAFLCF